ncbi:hypothetical protein NEOLEDRAFT_1140647 [Neolentinus lepideus HHB14362 ss-1]|uniref:Uncharacterized protein n=1 Tax=Neolentinus lepideus HHB14362 ss-1 TaxID=1314782 RepID=A0A165P525_9AGAM|nr:hypothetical protein NEOLEDRAFT_1140647 [Neolentinus lepideus HHB14362 ss-1]
MYFHSQCATLAKWLRRSACISMEKRRRDHSFDPDVGAVQALLFLSHLSSTLRLFLFALRFTWVVFFESALTSGLYKFRCNDVGR